MASSKSSLVNVKDRNTRINNEIVRKPSNSALKNVPAERARKMSTTSGASTNGRKVSTAKNRNPVQPSKAGVREGPVLQTAPPPVVGFRQLLVTKRLARNLKLRTTLRLAERRGRSCITYSDRPRRKTLQEAQLVEPSYRLDPPHRFGEYHGIIGNILEAMITGRLAKMSYGAEPCSRMAKTLAGDVQEKIKELHIDRYKLITLVHIGEINQQVVRVCSRGVWDTAVDSFVDYQYQNASLYCVTNVFGIYYE